MSDANWLESLAVGSRVAMTSRYGPGHVLGTVTKMTPTQVHVGYNKFRRKDGRLIGADAWGAIWIMEITPEILAKAQLQADMQTLQYIAEQRVKVSPELLREMVALYESRLKDPTP